MTFANPLSPWAFALVAAAAFAVAWVAYRRAPISRGRRIALTSLRCATLLLLILFLMRPVERSADGDARDAVVAILVDTSRSMSIQDAEGQRRIVRARAVVAEHLLPTLGPRFRAELLAYGDDLAPVSPDALSASARRSDVTGALRAVRDRFRGQPVAGIVLVSDGGDTSGTAEEIAAEGPPIFPLALGSATAGRDREVLSATSAEAVLDDSRVDLAVSVVGHGNGTAPIVVRLLENGRPIEVRQVTPPADGVPVRTTFRVAPGRGVPTIYTVEIPAAAGELVPENNSRSVLVQPPSRRRRVLLVEGAPGFEHSFLKRALAADLGLEVDSVVRKGRNEQGADTFYVQAARSRSAALAAGYPQKTEDLFQYDAIVLANVDGSQFSRAQLEATRDFVGRRGGGMLVLGAHSFLRSGLVDTAIQEVLPLEIGGRGRGVVPAVAARGTNRVALTATGQEHPVMQLGAGADDTRKRWDAVPALASTAPLGDPRPGASVLAVTTGAGGAGQPLVAVQRYGDGRSMIFAGEAAWRWRMMLPASDRSYDTFWRQAVRWLAVAAPDPVSVSVAPSASTGDSLPLRITVRSQTFEPLRDATVDVRLTAPDGTLQQLRAGREPGPGSDGRYVVHYRADQPGVYKVVAEAKRGAQSAGTGAASFLVGGADVEMTDPRVNQRLLQTLAQNSGGRMVVPGEGSALADSLRAAVPAAVLSVRRDLWHTGWSFAAIVLLLGAEWLVRRQGGMR
ncbi:MAG: glutamine amidotransferase [Vicinamibacterales bacterium]